MPGAVVDALRRYATHRGTSPGPLFRALVDRRGDRSRRPTTRSVLRIVRELGQRVGAHVWCHALRHTAITTAIERGQQAGIGLDRIRAFSRHRNIETMLVYRDEHDRAGVQRSLTDIVAHSLVPTNVPGGGEEPAPGAKPAKQKGRCVMDRSTSALLTSHELMLLAFYRSVDDGQRRDVDGLLYAGLSKPENATKFLEEGRTLAVQHLDASVVRSFSHAARDVACMTRKAA